uniref:Uncharacterized protein n=1 Tax=Utricularia reniformis TaxID=192314 RepID=A0A1Y0B2F8_9LAMI|nr:hypothetical protein AEK19_MT1378 [Utricularia reniformis]ART31574.1 hypothetical protein AEK19_MT1378 [Utricularia reniformis]
MLSTQCNSALAAVHSFQSLELVVRVLLSSPLRKVKRPNPLSTIPKQRQKRRAT